MGELGLQPQSESGAAASAARPASRRHLPAIVVSAGISILLTLAVLAVSRFDTVVGGGTIRAVPQQVTAGGSFETLPEAAQLAISRAIGDDLRGYWARPVTGGFRTASPHSPLRATFTAAGVTLTDARGSLRMSLAGYGEDGLLRPVAAVTPTARRARVGYARGPLHEWYANGPIGLEQGLELAAPPVPHGNGRLSFSFTISSPLRMHRSGPSVLFETASGRGAFREGALGVYDARGRLLPAALSISGRHLLLRADAAGAIYPLHIDPNICATTVVNPQLCNTTNNDPDAVAAAAGVVVVGNEYKGPTGDTTGSAWLFTEPASGWQTATQTATLVESPAPTPPAAFGASVAVTTATDGRAIVAVGDPKGNGGNGLIDVYSEPVTGWPSSMQPTAELTAPAGGATPGDIGGNILMTGNASGLATIATTGAEYTPGGGSAEAAVALYVEPSDGGWASTSAPTSYLAAPTTGDSFTLSGNLGITTDPVDNLSTVAITAYDNTQSQHDVLLYQEPAGGWAPVTTTSTASLTDPTGQPGGYSLAGSPNSILISSSPNAPHETVFASNSASNDFDGAVYVWAEPGGGWTDATTATATLEAATGSTDTYFGQYMGLDGTTLLVGSYHGKIFAFGQPAGGWGTTTSASFAAINTNGAAWSGSTYSIAGACGDAYLGDPYTESLQIVGDPTGPSICRSSPKVTVTGTGSGTVSGSGIDCPSTCSASLPTGSLLTLTAKPKAPAKFTGWSGGVCTGAATTCTLVAGDVTVTAMFNAPPTTSGRPKIGGTPKPGKTLTCEGVKWTNAQSIGYQWNRDGVPLYENIAKSRKVATLDEGSTLGCLVTATNPAGSVTVISKTVRVPIPKVKDCPGATGSLTGTTMGLLHLGMTRAAARRAYRHHSNRGKQYLDFFCLTPMGVRVGYASPKLVKTLSPSQRRKFKGHVVWASTSNPYYSLLGVRVGEEATVAAAHLGSGPPLHIGLNYWYLAIKGTVTLVLKVRQNTVQEIGIAVNSLTKTVAQQSTLMHSFE